MPPLLDGQPRNIGATPLPVGVGDGDGVGGEHRAEIGQDGLEAHPQPAVGVVLVDLVIGALLQRAQQLLNVDHGTVGDRVERHGAEVDEEGEVLGDEELVHLPQLERVTRRAGVVAQGTLSLAGRVEAEEVPLHRRYGVENALAPVSKLLYT